MGFLGGWSGGWWGFLLSTDFTDLRGLGLDGDGWVESLEGRIVQWWEWLKPESR